jgi:hypothetical protein
MNARDLAFAGDLPGALAAVVGRRDPDSGWIRAYVAAARGAFAQAESRARALRIVEHPVAVAAGITLGSVLRQTARHAEAREVDAATLLEATTDEMRAHALISLGADAVGLGEKDACAAHLVDAAPLLPKGRWRARVRHAWVTCEHALLTGDPEGASDAAYTALQASRRAKARRHEAKSMLFLGVALRGAGRAGAQALLEEAAELAWRTGARPIERVARAMLRPHR